MKRRFKVYVNVINACEKNKLMYFLKENCNKISIENDYAGRLSENEIYNIQNELVGELENNIVNQKRMYNENLIYKNTLLSTLGLRNEKQLEEYFVCMEKENNEIVQDFIFKKTKKKIEYCPDMKQGYLGNRITRVSYNSLGGLYNILFYDIKVLDALLGKDKDLFAYIQIGKKQFWNLTFYSNENVVFSVNTDEKYASCEFDKEMFQEFKKLNIVYVVD